MTIRQWPCPRCGHIVNITLSAEDNPDATIELLRREIRQLSETIACLRGSLGRHDLSQDSRRLS